VFLAVVLVVVVAIAVVAIIATVAIVLVPARSRGMRRRGTARETAWSPTHQEQRHGQGHASTHGPPQFVEKRIAIGAPRARVASLARSRSRSPCWKTIPDGHRISSQEERVTLFECVAGTLVVGTKLADLHV
jgi:hypothetical protein